MQRLGLSSILHHANIIRSDIYHDMRSRITRSQAGWVWMLVHPLFRVAIYAFVLSGVLTSKIPGTSGKYAYTLYLLSGIIAWTLFADILARSTVIFVEKAKIIKKIPFSLFSLPFVVAGEALIHNLILTTLTILIFALLGHPLTWQLLWLIPLALLVAALALGIGFTLGVINVFIRDVEQATLLATQLLFWMSPIVYLPEIIPGDYLPLLQLNPLYPLLESYHHLFLLGKPLAVNLALPLGVAGCTLVLAIWLIKRAKGELIDAL